MGELYKFKFMTLKAHNTLKMLRMSKQKRTILDGIID